MRLIDAKALIENRDLHIVIGTGDNICIDIADIAKATTIDAVAVVRCKDCKYWDDDRRCNGIENGLMRDYTKPDDFCSYGERETDGKK